jgi:hypothetical protein
MLSSLTITVVNSDVLSLLFLLTKVYAAKSKEQMDITSV